MIKTSGDSIPGSTSTGSFSATQPVLTVLRALLGEDQYPDIEHSVDLSLPVAANTYSREDALISILTSHSRPPEGSTAFNLVNKCGQNLAHLCAQLRYHRLLISAIEWGVDISIMDANGWTPLDFARFYDDLNAVDILEGGWEDDQEVLERGPFSPTQIKSINSSSPSLSPGSVQPAENRESPHSKTLPTSAIHPPQLTATLERVLGPGTASADKGPVPDVQPELAPQLETIVLPSTTDTTEPGARAVPEVLVYPVDFSPPQLGPTTTLNGEPLGDGLSRYLNFRPFHSTLAESAEPCAPPNSTRTAPKKGQKMSPRGSLGDSSTLSSFWELLVTV